MRKIELKKVKMELGTDLDYRQTMLDVLKYPVGQNGIDIPEMMKFLAVGKAVKEANGVLLLEEDEWETLKTRVEAERWRIVDQAIVDLVEAVRLAEKVSTNS